MLSHLVSYRVQLPVFSGPMELLLHHVRRQEVLIHEISIARILEDYLRHLEVLRELDLQDIGEFIVTASTLMEIKSRDLLPNEAIELEEDLDPRDDLIRRLLEYKRYRDLARELEGRAVRRSRQSALAVAVPRHMREQDDEDLLEIGDVQVWDLTAAFARLLDEIGQDSSMSIEVEKRDVAYYTQRLLERFAKAREIEFTQLFERSDGRYGLIGTLIAILEMMKQGYVTANQAECFGTIKLVYQGVEDLSVANVLAGIAVDEAAGDESVDSVAVGGSDDGAPENGIAASGAD